MHLSDAILEKIRSRALPIQVGKITININEDTQSVVIAAETAERISVIEKPTPGRSVSVGEKRED